ncbi:hypothetical protein SDC9_154996 [bioreactor metagenome]|uniref:Uncharacterized protein n=1 Tax=bioreactor metagenome TaxID=1076179 RepID=A0A645F0A1_9ZZZZ
MILLRVDALLEITVCVEKVRRGLQKAAADENEGEYDQVERIRDLVVRHNRTDEHRHDGPVKRPGPERIVPARLDRSDLFHE